MATQHLIHRMSIRWARKIQQAGLLMLTIAILGACGRNGASGGQSMNLLVGEVQEITLPKPGSKTTELTGTSDNSEVADVTPKPTPSQTGANSTASTAFLVKGVTAGTVRVVFSERQPGDAGPGKMVKTYLVRVKTK